MKLDAEKIDDLLKPALTGKMAVRSDEIGARQIAAMIFNQPFV